MAKLKDAELKVAGTGRELVMHVEVEINWDRGDDETEWELQVRFIGDDTALRGRNNVLMVHAVAVSPSEGSRKEIRVSGAGGVFDEDRGDDEVFAEVELLARTTGTRVVRTKTVKGDFSG